jgi:ribosome-associated protein
VRWVVDAERTPAGPRTPIVVGTHLTIPASDLTWRFGPSGGPGGQHANTSNTRAEVVFEFEGATCLDERQRQRLIEEFGPRLRVVVDDHRSQLRNRDAAAERLAERLAAALRPKRTRRRTKPSRGSKERRLKAKREQSAKKADRRRPPLD